MEITKNNYVVNEKYPIVLVKKNLSRMVISLKNICNGRSNLTACLSWSKIYVV